MGVLDILKKIRLSGRHEELPEPKIDRQLYSLRNLRQKQLDEMEKAKLKKDIAQYNHVKMREETFGKYKGLGEFKTKKVSPSYLKKCKKEKNMYY